MTDLNDVSFLKAKQEAMAEDIREVKDAIRDIATAMTTIATIEQKLAEQRGTTERLHTRIDALEERTTSCEVKFASNLWMERLMWALLTGLAVAYGRTFIA